MAPTSKENDVLVASPEAPAAVATSAPFRPDETASRPQPVALEIPVSVNGARTVEGSDKREPFSETTKTVLVFGNGAVIRLASPVSAGQLLFLTNEKTKKEVVCQVVKSKNYRNVSGYVELEFTESVVGFWGMRFPSDRIAAPAPTPAAGLPPVAKVNLPAPAPAAPKAAAPVVSAAPTPITEVKPAALPVAPLPVVPAAPVAAQPAAVPPVVVPPAVPIAVQTPPPVAPVAKVPEPAVSASPNIAASLASSVANLLGSPEVPPAVTASKPTAPAVTAPTNGVTPANSGDTSTEQLKQQAARLQEQLSSMLFSSTAPAPPAPLVAAAPPPAAVDAPAPVRLTSKVLELAKVDAAPVKAPPLTKTVPPPPPVKSSLDTEEVKIPSWLEPLARNAAAPASTQELIEREKARHAAEVTPREEGDAQADVLATTAVESATELATPSFGNSLPLDEAHPEKSAGGSGKGLWIGVAAAVLVAAAGGWYFLRPTSSAPSAATPVTRPAVTQPTATTPASAPAPAAAQPVATLPTPEKAVVPQTSASSTGSEYAARELAAKTAANKEPIPSVRENARTTATPSPAPATERTPERATRPAEVAEAAAPEPKKQTIGEVHLASPMVNRTETSQDDAAPTISASPDTTANLNNELITTSAKQPAPALPVGGDVKPAKLVSSVPPVYPTLAKNQHVTGDVSIDALIDANGKVTTMKVISGAALLRQAAMEAVRQWKYQPASLDDKPVPMHLTVTVQFRIP